MPAKVVRVERTELPSMVATLCCYESLFGPYHPQTLCLMTEVALALWHHGEAGRARGLLERAVHDLGRLAGPDHNLRIRAITSLRDLLVQQSDYEEAGVVQMELLEC